MIRAIITAAFLLVICFGKVLGQFPDSAQGILRLTETSHCADTCTTYYVDPDSGFSFRYINGALDQYIGQHVRIYGVVVPCVLCGGIRALRIDLLAPTETDPNNHPLLLTFTLIQNYPNPFNPVTRISYTLPKASYVRLKVYNVLGEQVASLVDGHMQPGTWSVDFDGTRLPSGMYFYRLTAGKYVEVKKMMLVK